MRKVGRGIAAAVLLAAAGCSDGKAAGADGGTDGGGAAIDASFEPRDAGTGSRDAGHDATVDAGPAAQTYCTQAELDAAAADFRTFGQVDVSVGRSDAGAFAFVNRCAKIRVGQKVLFSLGDFSIHPLRGVESRPTNPIPRTTSGTQAISVTFDEAGEFGYFCENHGSMVGAVKVVAN